MRKVGLAGSNYATRLTRLLKQADGSLDSDWDTNFRERVALELRKLSDQIGAIATSQQSEYDDGYGPEQKDV